MKSATFWDITPCSPLKVNLRFGGTYRLNLPGRISRASVTFQKTVLFKRITAGPVVLLADSCFIKRKQAISFPQNFLFLSMLRYYTVDSRLYGVDRKLLSLDNCKPLIINKDYVTTLRIGVYKTIHTSGSVVYSNMCRFYTFKGRKTNKQRTPSRVSE
jgi:hypothetical protein